MAQWFHRNPFKATTAVKFSLGQGGNPNVNKVCDELKSARIKLLNVLVDPNLPTEAVGELFKNYLALLGGFIIPIDNKEGSKGTPSKLRHCFLFKWTHTLLGNVPQSVHDAVYEAASMSINVAIWHMKHASMIAASDNVSLEESKIVHSELKLAATVFKFVEDFFIPMFIEKPLPGGDFDMKVLRAYLNQCIAEAQEVTLARAIELKHNPNLISAIAKKNSDRFLEACNLLENSKATAQWKTYLKLKSIIYLAYAYCFCGENLLSQDKCGEAIRALQESQKYHAEALNWCKQYGKIKNASSQIKPESHLFFRRLASVVTLSLNKCERENSFIYHQKVPNDVPALETESSFGMVTPDEMNYPDLNPLWTPALYAEFPSRNINMKELSVSDAASKVEELPPVNEIPIKHTSKDQKNKSGCNIQ